MDFFYEEFDNRLVKAVDTLKMLLYKRHNNIFERLDFEDDDIFMEPLLYAYITQNDDKWLDSIIVGYEKNIVDFKIAIYKNIHNKVYIPKIGYFKISSNESDFFLLRENNQYSIVDANNNIVSFEYSPISYLDEGIEIVCTQHPLFENLFIDPNNSNVVDVKIEDNVSKHLSHFNNALNIIKSYYNDYFQLIRKNVKKVMIYEGEPYSFAAIQAHNMIFLNAHDWDDEIFFLDHILHEGAHVIFNTLTFETKKELFTVPFNSLFSLVSNNPQDHGELYGRFHGMFTQSNINPCLEICLRKNLFTGKQRKELLGRFVSNMNRFNSGILTFNITGLYKEEGNKWYSFFQEKFHRLYDDNKEILESYNVSNQPYVFSYKIFDETNPD